MGYLPKNIAIVYDRVNKWGGAERVLLSLHKLFPTARLFTSVYDVNSATWAEVFPDIKTTFIQNIPWARTNHEYTPWLSPLAFETCDFSEFDIVISVTSAEAKGILTGPNTLHICYCLTPTRYLWSHSDTYSKSQSRIARIVSHPLKAYLRYWDKVASQRPDKYIAISKTVQNRIATYYDRKSDLVYPPVDIDKFSNRQGTQAREPFFLWVGRFVNYKRPDIVSSVFNKLNKPLVMIGEGKLKEKIESYHYPNVKVLGQVSDSELSLYYSSAQALIMFHEEDFGLVSIEAMSHGTPVIGLMSGGTGETIIHNQTGLLIHDSIDALIAAISGFEFTNFVPDVIRKHAQTFSESIFSVQFPELVSKYYTEFRTSMGIYKKASS